MFKNTKAFSGFSVDDLEKARHFYGDVLKIKVIQDKAMPVLELHIEGGIPLVIYEKPNHNPATFTVLNFPVDNIETAVTDLEALGVVFEDYDFPGLKTGQDHIFRDPDGGPQIAWFKDPAGNILSVLQ